MSILAGVDNLIDDWCGLSSAGGVGTGTPLYANKSAARLLSEHQRPLGSDLAPSDTTELFKNILDQIRGNFRADRQVSDTLWVLRKETGLDPINNKSSEKLLEKVIASCLDPTSWYNQLTTASGLRSAHADKARNIDLVHKRHDGKSAYEFIELKYQESADSHGANNPLYAAWEIVCYGLLYVFARTTQKLQSLPHRPLLDATKVKKVHLIVLAPEGYYQYKRRAGDYRRYRLEWLEEAINKGLKSVTVQGLMIDFVFQKFTPEFGELYNTPKRLPDAFQAFRKNNLSCRERVYGQ